MKVSFNVSAPLELANTLKAHCQERGEPTSQVVVAAIESYLGNPPPAMSSLSFREVLEAAGVSEDYWLDPVVEAIEEAAAGDGRTPQDHFGEWVMDMFKIWLDLSEGKKKLVHANRLEPIQGES